MPENGTDFVARAVRGVVGELRDAEARRTGRREYCVTLIFDGAPPERSQEALQMVKGAIVDMLPAAPQSIKAAIISDGVDFVRANVS